MIKHHTPEDIQIVLQFMSIYPHSGSNREAKDIILQLQNEIESMTREADNRVQAMADKLEEAQQRCNDLILKSKVKS